MVSDTRFWNGVESLESQFLMSDISEVQFRSRMRRKGFDTETINERVEAVQADYRGIFRCDHISKRNASSANNG